MSFWVPNWLMSEVILGVFQTLQQISAAKIDKNHFAFTWGQQL